MEEISLTDCLAILRRWKRLFLATAGVLLAVSLSFALTWSNYRSTATLQIEQPEIDSSATTASDIPPLAQAEILADKRVGALRQKILSTASLADIITKLDLYAAERKKKPLAAVAEAMRDKIKISPVSGSWASPSAANRSSLGPIAFTLSFSANDPHVAQRVTNELASRFLDQDLKERQATAQETSAFLSTQIKTLDTSLSEQEKKIAAFQNSHGVARPEALGFNQQIVATLTLSMQALDSQIATNEGTLGALEAQLASVDPYSRVMAEGRLLTTPSTQLKALQAQYASLTSRYSPNHPDVIKLRRQIAALHDQIDQETDGSSLLTAQLADVRANLEAARKTYGPRHPDVLALEKEVQSLEHERAITRLPLSSDRLIVDDADNPAYLQLVAQLHSAEEKQRSLLRQRKDLRQQLDTYRDALMANPETQKEMAGLSRDYENAKIRYRALKEKKMIADMREQRQKDRKDERLILVDPPECPIDTHPRLIVLILGSVLVSFFGGAGTLVLVHLLSQRIVGAHHLESVTGAQPLVTIPHIESAKERSRRRYMKKGLVFAGKFLSKHFPHRLGHLIPVNDRERS
ncbi:MAG: hypothetical protein PHS57_03320 [Alphaproteobacteria bacterium]|nr:hypothetical protein [Alphaproteobacteria bacterium]